MSSRSAPEPSEPDVRPSSQRATRLLVASPDPRLREQLATLFHDLCVDLASDDQAAIELAGTVLPDVILLDMRCGNPAGDRDPGEIIGPFLGFGPSIRLIAVVGEGRRDQASAAISAGAADFYHLPLENDVLPVLVRRALRVRELELENQLLRSRCDSPMSLAGIVGQSAAVRATFRTIEKVAPTGATVLLLGESGTGKELLAKALHQLGTRAARPFCAINCAAIPETLLETELFGHEKGAFTGAVKQTQGRFELAAGGTVFLDEIGEMSAALQAKLLRVIQERLVERVGGRTSIPLDIRIVCATHRDLRGMLGEQRFREDLYYRISEVTVQIPPLRERDGDAVLLARHFLLGSMRRHRSRVRGLSPDALRAIQCYAWPGNVRELENRINSAVIMAEGSWLTAQDLGLGGALAAAPALRLRDVRKQAERQALDQALAATAGNLTRASSLLGITRPTLYDLIARHGIDASRFAVEEPA
jgi:two-component system NtrC family response regulator